jgi:hypothetical protein
MLRGYALAALAFALALGCAAAYAQVDGEQTTPGGACDHGATAGHGNRPDWDTLFECNGSTQWQRGPYFFGSSADTCDSNHAGMVQWTGSVISPNNTLEYCNGSTWGAVGGSSGGVYDLSMFYPGTVSSNAIARVVSARTATYPSGLTGSYCVAKEGATSSTTITLHQIHAGSSTNVGTVVFAGGSGGSTNVTNCTFAAASGISLAVGDALEFAFPSTPDATLGDVSITIAGTHN